MLTSTETTPQAKHVFFFSITLYFHGCQCFLKKKKAENQEGQGG